MYKLEIMSETILVIYLAGGCFWGVEHYIQLLPGVVETEVGYANSIIENPSYEEVCSGRTEAAETVKVSYDSSKISLSFLLEQFFQIIDPTTINRQGNDRGTQYRTGVYYTDAADRPIIMNALARLQSKYSKILMVEVKPLKNYSKAETYHQDYLSNRPGGYCHVPIEMFGLAKNAVVPTESIASDNAIRTAERKRLSESKEQLKQRLSPIQYLVTQNEATERPFTNEYNDTFEDGIYVDIVSGEPLFCSKDKYNAGCGWPSFTKPIQVQGITKKSDFKLGYERIEVRSSSANSHLGHVFEDGPKERGGYRYCINSAALRFVPKARMISEGYGDYLYLFGDSTD